MTQGPLTGLRVLELAGLGPAPFASALLADAGADVVRVDRPGSLHDPTDILARGRRSIALDLKRPADVQTLLALAAKADLLIEGFRPGVIERLGLGPAVLLERNPQLVIGRMTGWGQSGPLAAAPGHDINYIALSGALASIGSADGPPVPPLNLVGDFGGGAMLLLFGVMAALHEAQRSGRGHGRRQHCAHGHLPMDALARPMERPSRQQLAGRRSALLRLLRVRRRALARRGCHRATLLPGLA
jgi:alpha-methylacyl-CoA racemase